MPHVLFIHLNNADPLLMDCDELPKASDNMVIGRNPRRKDNKDVTFIEANVQVVMFPMSRISFIEVMPTGEDEEIFTPFRSS
jgi:hypothetical protein